MHASNDQGRVTGMPLPAMAEGWSFERVTPPSRLFGANGLRTGADGRIYVAQCIGSQISAVDPDSGVVEIISGIGGGIVAPDDLDFDDGGAIYSTEVMNARVSVTSPAGKTRILCGDLPNANGITFHHGRLFIDECRPGGRLLELDLSGGAPKLLAEGLPLPNALAPGPDGKLYFPLLAGNEIWRIDPDGGEVEHVATGLDHPVAVKFDSSGYIVSPQSGSGAVLRIDPRTGEKTVLAQLDPGLDNLTFIGDRLFVSHMTDGAITEILPTGKLRGLLPGGLQFPLDMTTGPDNTIYFADNCVLYRIIQGEAPQAVGRLFAPGFPGTLRGVAACGDGRFIVGTTDGRVMQYDPTAQKSETWAEDLDQIYAVAIGAGNAAFVAEMGGGRILSVRLGRVEAIASGLQEPTGIAIDADGTCFASESGGGQVVKVTSTGVTTVVDGLERPEGLAIHDGVLYILDADAKTLISCDPETGDCLTLARDLPVGAPPGVEPKPLLGFPPLSGPLGPFAGLTATTDGVLYLSAGAEGSVIAIRKDHPTSDSEWH